jgi:uncharacterized protein with HEPN domain
MPTEESILIDIVGAAEDAIGFVSGLDESRLMASKLHQYAVIRSLEVIGEVARNLPDTFRVKYPELPWRNIIGMRNRLIHGYGELDLDVIWDVARNKLPELIAALRPLLPPE